MGIGALYQLKILLLNVHCTHWCRTFAMYILINDFRIYFHICSRSLFCFFCTTNFFVVWTEFPSFLIFCTIRTCVTAPLLTWRPDFIIHSIDRTIYICLWISHNVKKKDWYNMENIITNWNFYLQFFFFRKRKEGINFPVDRYFY